ncbi:MAG TPA: STAS domain-containing protein [Actinomycetota bacterium]|nr:STAS domain-containing protein [Actinomycetota bacterium]
MPADGLPPGADGDRHLAARPDPAVEGAGMSAHWSDSGGCTVLELVGEIDMAEAPRLTALLSQAGSPHFVVDLTRLTFIDSTGLAVLVSGWRQASSTGGSMRLVGPQRAVSKMLQITGLDQVLPIHDSLEQAVRLSLSGCQPGARQPAAERTLGDRPD